VAINAVAGREREKKLSRPAHSSLLRRRVNPRAASGGGARTHAPLVAVAREKTRHRCLCCSRRVSQHCYGFLRGYIVMF